MIITESLLLLLFLRDGPAIVRCWRGSGRSCGSVARRGVSAASTPLTTLIAALFSAATTPSTAIIAATSTAGFVPAATPIFAGCWFVALLPVGTAIRVWDRHVAVHAAHR